MDAEGKGAKKDWLLERLQSTGGILLVTTMFVMPPIVTAVESFKASTDQSIRNRVLAARSKLQNVSRSSFADPSGNPASYAKDGFDKAFDKAFDKNFDKVAHAKDWDKKIA